jgi:CheY-like chemotaxis protein
MNLEKRPPIMLIAEDDPDDRQWIKEALVVTHVNAEVRFVEDGEELMDFLFHRGKYKTTSTLAYPGMIILDLNMPKKDGREALKEIKSDPRLRHIPIIILTTSKSREDVFRTYDLGANSVILKPVKFSGLTEIMQSLKQYWFEMTELPLN